MRRSLIRAASPLGLVVVVGALAFTVTACTKDQASIGLPTAPSSTVTTSTSRPTNTRSVKLFSGKTVFVDSFCAVSHHLSSHKADAVAAAKKLPLLKQVLLNTRRDLNRFLAAHPGHTLTADAYATYRSLRARDRSALARYNRQVSAYNRLAGRFNADLHACKRG
jgi:hypothetical protein